MVWNNYGGYSDLVETTGLDESVNIHPTAQVAKGAELGKGVKIGSGAIVGPKVVLDDGVIVGAGSIIEGRTQVGKATQIFPYATIGMVPQDLKFKGEDARLEIGKYNRIREYANISIGTDGGGNLTKIGDANLIMVYTHVGHDCIIGDECILANSVHLAGHVTVGDRVVFGGMSAAHQFSRFGDLVMVAAGGMVSQDVPAFCTVHGNRARITGLNIVGLRRAGIKNISAIKTMYRLVYSDNLTMEDAIERIESEVDDINERRVFVEFLRGSERGICR